jgi:predicted secreted protein
MALPGKSAVVSVSIDDTTWHVVSQIKEVDLPLSATNIDVSVFGVTFVQRIQGLKDATYTLTGFVDPTDTNGQVAIQSSWLNDTALYIQVNYGGGLVYSQQVKVNKIDNDAAVDGAITTKIDLDGTGVATVAV